LRDEVKRHDKNKGNYMPFITTPSEKLKHEIKVLMEIVE
jgi:hypothetical protein